MAPSRLFCAILLLAFSVSAAASNPEATTKVSVAKKAVPDYTVAVAADRSDALYSIGQRVVFTITVTHRGQPAAASDAEWTLSKDGVSPTQRGKVRLQQGRGTVSGLLDEAGFLQCRVAVEIQGEKLSGVAAAGISPLEIPPSAPTPEDFDAFWQAKKQALAAVPGKANLAPVASGRDGVEAFDLKVESLGAPVSGYFARPTGAKPRSLPAVLTVHGAGVRSAGLSTAMNWAREGALAIDLNAHGIPNGRDGSFYEALAAGELKDYRRHGLESRDRVYFLGMFLRLVRAIDFLTNQPEWDGRTVVVSGSSQGGAQAIAAAGIDQRVSFFVAGVPAMADHTGSLANRIAGWPKFIAAGETSGADVVQVVKYYDAVNFAARAKAPGFFTVGFIDTTCPPTSVYAAYNALKAPKEIFNDITSGHTNTPAASAAMRSAVLRHLATQRDRVAAPQE